MRSTMTITATKVFANEYIHHWAQMLDGHVLMVFVIEMKVLLNAALGFITVNLQGSRDCRTIDQTQQGIPISWYPLI